MIHLAPMEPERLAGHPGAHRRLLVRLVALLLAALATWLVWRAYQQPDFLIELGSLMLLC